MISARLLVFHSPATRLPPFEMSQESPHRPAQDPLVRAEIDFSLRHPVMFFFTSGAAWLAVAILLGVIASAKVHAPGFMSAWPWLTYGRVMPAHLNAFVYGWACQAAFGVLIWLMARLSRQKCRNAGTILMAGHLWNLGVGLGVVGILSGHSTGIPWMEFPIFAWPVMLFSYAAIVVWSLVQFRGRPQGHVFVSQWYSLAALLWFPWLFVTANVLLHCLSGHPVMAAAINAWYKSALILLFFVPTATAAAYYLMPKVTGRPLHSYALSLLGFWALAIIAPWAGMQKLAGAPVPYFLPYVGAAATVLVAIPLVAAAVNILRTTAGEADTVLHSPALRFTMAGVVGMAVFGVLGALLALPESTLPLSQFSLSGYGYEMLGLYGFFSLVMFGAIYFIVPRLTRREWISRRLISSHFWFSVYGAIFIILFAIFGGLMQGVGQEEWQTLWANAANRVVPYAVGNTFAWAMLLFSNFFFFIHLALMWLRLGRRSTQPILLIHESDEESPHGPEGDIDNAGPAHAH